MNNLDISNSVFSEKDITDAIGQCEISEYNVSRSCNGLDVLEIGVIDMYKNRHIIVLRNMGSKISKEKIYVDIIDSRKTRNRVIKELHTEHNLTQQFLAKYFNLSQSTISIIVNNKI